MNRKKKILFLSILIMAIGFASVSTVLYLNGTIGIGTNDADFDVYYSKAIENGTENTTLIKDKTHLEFTTELTGVDDTYVLDYEVTNGSKQYDANLIINCTGGNEYLRVENRFDTTEVLPARTTRKGKLTLTVIQAAIEEKTISISCEISGNAVERDVIGGDAIEVELGDYLKISGNEYSSTNYLGYSLDKSKVETIKLVGSNEVPKDATLIGDVSNKQNGSIMMYTKDEDNNSKLELYIGQNDGVKLNPDSSHLFPSFDELVSIEGLENLDTSYVKTMNGMFLNCYKLTNLNVSKFNTSNVTNMGYMFSGCGSLTSIDVSNFITSKVTSMECMFADCASLNSLDLSHFNTSNVTNMRMMLGRYNGNMKISEILGISNLIIDNVEDIGGMFQNCANLSSLDLSNWNTDKVKSMATTFNGCSKLTNLNISNFNTSNVTTMSGMFADCRYLKTIDLSHFDTRKVTDMNSMFYYCYNLTSLDVSSFDTSNVTDMHAMFQLWDSPIKEIIGISNFVTDNVTNMKDMFNGCENLETLDLSKWNTSKVRNTSSMFNACKKLATLNISHFDTSNVTDMDSMFRLCSSLASLDLSHFNTSNVKYMSNMFQDCNNLSILNTSNFDTSNVTNMKYLFYGCNKLKTTFTVIGSKCTSYTYMFNSAATSGEAEIIVNYSEEASDLVDKMIATKSSGSKVVKGSNISKAITIQNNDEVMADYTKGYKGQTITLSYKDETKIVTSFKVNGTLVNGDSFKMPDEEATITDIVLKKVIFDITINGNDTISSNVKKARRGTSVVLSTNEENKAVTSFKMNGISVEGCSFAMPKEDVTITDIVIEQIPSPNAEKIKKVTPDEIFLNDYQYQNIFIVEKFGSMEKFREYRQEVCKDGYDSEICQNAENELMNEMGEWLKYLHVFATYKYGSIDNYKEWQINACIEGESSTTCQNAMTQFFNGFKKWKNS